MKSPFKIGLVIVVGLGLSMADAADAKGTPGGQAGKPVVVANPKEPVPPSGQRTKVVFREELTIGVEEGDENYMFGSSIQVTADERGGIYVLDWSRKRIQKFDPAGKFLFSIGRAGQGPGEFGNLWEMRFDGRGRIYITDIANKRITFFDKETGRFAEAIKLEASTGAVILLSNGTYFTSTNTREDRPDGPKWAIPYGIFDRDFKLKTEFRRDGVDFTGLPEYADRARFVAGMLSRSAFKPNVITAVTDDERLIVGYPDRYEFTVYDRTGEPRLLIKKDAAPRLVTDGHKDYYFQTAVLSFLASSGGNNRPKDEDVRKAMVYPKLLPAYNQIIPMDDGLLFVVTDTLPRASTVDLFDAKGAWLGSFVTDVPASTLIFRNGKAYGVEEIDDYHYVKRYAYTLQKY
ncbi:MAG: 6-bladed beta-propeller [Candidatus Aminicenantes bacterium]|nr:6-bladed beta-propeller [Candidatus Aminicenantes bacterium]